MVDQTCFYSKGAESVTWVWDLIMESVGREGQPCQQRPQRAFQMLLRLYWCQSVSQSLEYKHDASLELSS